MSGDEDVMAAMGFSAFGRPRERHNVKQVANKTTDALPQLMPGTEIAGKLAGFSRGSMEHGPQGVVYLLCKEKNIDDVLPDEGVKKNDGEDASLVPCASLLEELEREKCKFDTLEKSQFLSARAATNSFESLGKHRFLNRSAMKLVTLDHIFQWTQDVEQREEVFTFADICGGPGGFSEYLLWRTAQATDGEEESVQRVCGYGITLKDASDNCDWRLPSKFRDFFEICYGEDGTGNLYSVANIHNFRDVVRRSHPTGVNLAVADGGFLDARSQSNQESMMTKLVLAEVLAMFNVLCVGGDFVCKTFELATPAMIQLCWLLHRCFDRFAIVKPITSRPASSERYIVARGLRAGHPTSKLVATLEDCLAQNNSINSDGGFQGNILANSMPMLKDEAFLQYIALVNEAIARSQVQACRRINEFAANQKKRKTREADTVIDPRQYYEYWKLGKSHR